MRKHSVWIRAGVLVAAAGLVLAACGGGGDEGSTGGGTSAGPSIPVTTDHLLWPSDKKGGTLKALSGADCDSWDPARTYYATCWDQQRWISRSLLNYKPAPKSTELVPDLAAEVPTSPDGGKTWTVHLKDGIKFEDGTPITSKDVKYGIERVFATDVINGGPTYVIDYLDDPNNKYPGPYKDTDPNKLGLKSVETPDDKTLIFHLNKPFNDWPYIMASPSVSPVPQAKDTGDRYTSHPVASGPYKFEKYVPNQSLSLVRNDQWDPSTDEVNKALPDRIEITMGLEAADIDNRIMNGDADLFLDQTGVDTAARTKLLSDPTLRKARTTIDLSGFLRYLSIATTVKPLDNIHCRNAVAWVVDKQAQVLSRGGPTAGDPATTMLPPTLPYYTSFDVFPTPNNGGDITKAKDELKACGQPNGFSTKLTARGNRPAEVNQAVAIQSDLKKIGINATIEKFDSSQYFAAVVGIPKNVQSKGYGLMMDGWGPDWPSAYGFFSSIVDGRKILPQGNQNIGELNDPAVNKGIDDGLAAGDDDATAQKAWTSVDKGVVTSAAYVPLIYDKAMNLYSDRITNVFFAPGYNMINFAALGVVR